MGSALDLLGPPSEHKRLYLMSNPIDLSALHLADTAFESRGERIPYPAELDQRVSRVPDDDRLIEASRSDLDEWALGEPPGPYGDQSHATTSVALSSTSQKTICHPFRLGQQAESSLRHHLGLTRQEALVLLPWMT